VRILFLALDVDLSTKTGDSTHVRELATSLSTIGHELLLVGHIPEDARVEVSDYFGKMNVPVKVPEKTGDLSTLRFCSQVARDFKPDVIYERRFSPKIGVTLSKLLRVPVTVEINAMVEEELKLLDKEQKGVPGIGRIKRRIRRFFLRSADGLVAVSKGIGKGLENEYDVDSSRIHVVQNGANTDLFRPLDLEDCRKRLGLDEGLHYLCYSGNLAPWQGMEHLVSALPRLIEDFEDLRLIIVGDGVLREELEKAVGDKGLQDVVSFFGTVPYEDVPRYLCAADICVAPFSGILRNVKYGFSAIKLFEYMACGRPFVTTSVCGIEREIDENDVGLVVPPDSPQDLAEALRKLLDYGERTATMGERGRILAEREHSWVAVARRITSILEETSRD
jgi:glycosyltransferase involved in cell wall biosynthesis